MVDGRVWMLYIGIRQETDMTRLALLITKIHPATWVTFTNQILSLI